MPDPRMPVDTPPMKAALQFLTTLVMLAVFAGVATAGQTADRVLVIKSKERLYLIRNDEDFASYHVVFGANPKGHKQQQGDERTPEGHYTLGYKNAHSSFYKSIHISYPNREDRIRAREHGIRPGGDIMIHGQANGWEWISPFSRLHCAFEPRHGCCLGCRTIRHTD